MEGHYFHQDLLIAQKIFQSNPTRHIDIGSRIDGFVAHVAAFRRIEVFDIRPLRSTVANIVFTQADLMKLPPEMEQCCDSASSLHAIEHFGLGRYGDPIDVDGHLKAIQNIHSMLKPSGKFYFSVPIGKQRIEFNAHRVFSIKYLLGIFKGKFRVSNFHYVDDQGALFRDAVLTEDVIANDFNCLYGCGIFELSKNLASSRHVAAIMSI
jgi:SAM-dependent methyltransferase